MASSIAYDIGVLLLLFSLFVGEVGKRVDRGNSHDPTIIVTYLV